MSTDNKNLGEAAFSSIDIVGQCAMDKERTLAFKKAVFSTVKKGDISLDLGTGSGIMAIFASQAGATKSIGVEYDPFIAEIAKKNITHNNLNTEVIIADAMNLELNLNKPVDVVISEMLTTGVIDEIQVQAINNLHKKGYVNGDTKFIPYRHDTTVTLVEAKPEFFGVNLPMIIHLWRWHKELKSFKRRELSTEILVNSLDFRVINEEVFKTTLSVPIKRSGMLNGVIFQSKTFLDIKNTRNVLGDTEALNAPVFVPLKPMDIRAGQTVTVSIGYTFGGGFETLSVEII